MADAFRTDRHHWTPDQQEQVQLFFKCNKFFSSIYEPRYFQELAGMSYYANVLPDQPLLLAESKRPEAIILLSGHLSVYSKDVENKHHRKKHKGPNKQMIKLTELHSYNESITVTSDCKLVSLHGSKSECLFVPHSLYSKFMNKRKYENYQVVFNLLVKIFKVVERRPVMEVAQSGCLFKQLRFGSHIYQIGDKPESVFIILEGSAKILQPSLSKKIGNTVVVSTNFVLGEDDLYLPERQTEAVCCSSHIRLLEIPKNSYLKFAKGNLPNFKEPKTVTTKVTPKKREKQKSPDIKLPLILRVSSEIKSKQQEEREDRLIQNSHKLLNSARMRHDRVRVRSSLSDMPRDIMQDKIRFYKKLRPNEPKVDLSHRIV